MSLTVAGSLLVAVLRCGEWMGLSIFIPVAGALFAPLACAFAAFLGVGRIVREFPASVVGVALLLALRAAADELSGMALRGLEGLQVGGYPFHSAADRQQVSMGPAPFPQPRPMAGAPAGERGVLAPFGVIAPQTTAKKP